MNLKESFRKFHDWLDNVVNRIVGDSSVKGEPSSQAVQSTPPVPVPAPSPESEKQDPDFNPFESAPNMEDVIAPLAKAKTAQKKPSGFQTKNTVRAQKLYTPPPRNVAGMKTRKSGEQAESNQIVQNETNDTIYSQRNETVAVVYERYSKYGDKIASAVLSKSFLPNGLQMILNKLEIQSVGSPLPDHDQVVDWIDDNGVEEFCTRMKIRT